MKETVFHAELAAALRAEGYWMAKWPDQAVSRMQQARDGKLRFSLPKPCDLIGADPDGRLVAIECKLLRARSWRVDARTARQVETLRDMIRGRQFARAYLALNWRFEAKKPTRERVNRAFLYAVEPSDFDFGNLLLTPEKVAALQAIRIGGVLGIPLVSELVRVSGGWRL